MISKEERERLELIGDFSLCVLFLVLTRLNLVQPHTLKSQIEIAIEDMNENADFGMET